MKAGQKLNFKAKDIIPYEHLRFILETTSPYQRMKWLSESWNFWRALRKKNYSKAFPR